MAPLWFVPAGALLVAFVAALMARLRHLSQARARRELAASALAAAICVTAGMAAYAAAALSWDEWQWRNAAAGCFIGFPIVAVLILNLSSRRHPPLEAGSSIGSFLAGAFAVAALAGWATYSWRGPRGGWDAYELLVFAVSVIALFAGSACAGWWCGRRIRQGNA